MVWYLGLQRVSFRFLTLQLLESGAEGERCEGREGGEGARECGGGAPRRGGVNYNLFKPRLVGKLRLVGINF